jgi:hypothetical protein
VFDDFGAVTGCIGIAREKNAPLFHRNPSTSPAAWALLMIE